MAIVKMNQFTLMTFHSHRPALLKELQKFENAQFKDLQKDKLAKEEYLEKVASRDLQKYEAALEEVVFSLQKLEPYAGLPKGFKAMMTPSKEITFAEFDTYLETYGYKEICQKVRQKDEQSNAIKSQRSRILGENDALRPWSRLDVAPKEMDRLKSTRAVIGTVNKMASQGFKDTLTKQFPALYIEEAGSVKEDVIYLLLIHNSDYHEVNQFLKQLGFSKTNVSFKEIPKQVIEANIAVLDQLQAEQELLDASWKELGPEYERLAITRDYLETVLEREQVCNRFLKSRKVLIIRGWVPQEDAETFHKIIDAVCGQEVYLEEEAVAKEDEEVPIKLKNNIVVSSFESIIEMYSMPRYGEMDPTPVLSVFYWLFFGFMVGDTGYGLILLIASAIALKFFNLKPGGQRFMRFFFILSFSVIGAGFIYGSFFGFSFFTPLTGTDGAPKAIMDMQQDILLMLIMSVALGVIHIFAALIVKGVGLIRDGDPLGAVFDALTYLLTLSGAIILLLGGMGMLGAPAFDIGKWMSIIGLVSIALTQGRSSKSIVGKIGNGLYEVYGLTGYVGDIVSYTRIAALALSGGYIGLSFNMMAGMVPAGFIRIIFGGLIMIAGHAINFGLGLLSAYVHTSRLQYVEYYGKFYEGGGVPYAPFKLKNSFITIKK